MLTAEQLTSYLEEGILVVDNILTPSEVRDAQVGLSRTLAQHGIDTTNLRETGHNLRHLSSTNGSGGVLDIFYPNWKLRITTNERLFRATCQLWEAAYCHCGEHVEDLSDGKERIKWHPYGPFNCNRGYIYIDRIGYRLPTKLAEEIGAAEMVKQEQQQQQQEARADCTTKDALRNTRRKMKIKPIQRSLTPHLDCCPETFNSSKNKSKWRPIQCFISLTDNMEANTGGFEAAPGFHKDFHLWAQSRPSTTIIKKSNGRTTQINIPPPCVGEYTHIRPREDRSVMERIKHIPAKAGSVVFWDNRIPHANAYRNDGTQARAVVYCSFLPDVPINREYVQRQLEDWKCGRRPRDQWIEVEDEKDLNKGASKKAAAFEKVGMDGISKFTDLGRKLMGMDKW